MIVENFVITGCIFNQNSRLFFVPFEIIQFHGDAPNAERNRSKPFYAPVYYINLLAINIESASFEKLG